jgi:hypothetical protein
MFYLLLVILLINSSQSWDSNCGLEPAWGDCNSDEDCHPELDSLNNCDSRLLYCRCASNQIYAGKWCNITRYDSSMVGGLQFLGIIGIGGMGNFMLDNNEVGAIIQAVCCSVGCLCLTGLIITCCLCCCDGEDAEGECGLMVCFIIWGFMIYLFGVIWSIIDAADIFSGRVKDSDGYFPQNSECINNNYYVIW